MPTYTKAKGRMATRTTCVMCVAVPKTTGRRATRNTWHSLSEQLSASTKSEDPMGTYLIRTASKLMAANSNMRRAVP